MNADMEEYYAANKFYLSRIGAWPYQYKKLKILLPCVLTTVQFSVIVTEILLLYDNWNDIDTTIEGLINISLVVGSSAKLINIVVNNDKFRRLLQFMNDQWVLFNSKPERYILRHYAEIGRRVTKYYAAYCYTILVLFLLIPLIPRILDIVIPLNESRPLQYIYDAEYKVDKNKYYYPILLHAFLSSTITIVTILTIDTTYITCVLHTCSLLTAISHCLENIEDDHELMICLKKHQFALEHVQILDSLFTHVTFFILSLNVLIMSIIGLHLLNKLGDTKETVRCVCMTAGVITHLICMCFPGQLLIDRSAEVFNKAYSSQWYTFSVKSKKLLGILLYRSLVPCTLSAGKMFVMSMTLCSSVMQTAMSYFTTFSSMK